MAFIAEVLNSIPNSLAASVDCLACLATAKRTPLKLVTACEVVNPTLVKLATTALTSSKETPVLLANGKTLPKALANSSKVVLP